MAIPTSSLFGLAGLGNALSAREDSNVYRRLVDAQMQRQMAAMENRRWAELSAQRASPGDWLYVSADGILREGVVKAPETDSCAPERPVKALRREIEGWLPKLD